MKRKLHIAVVGAGPAGIYASDILAKSGLDVKIDLFEKLPAPYGLVRYGVAPDHPRIKQIISALYRVLEQGEINLLGNVNVGKDITPEELAEHYDAVIYATGSDADAPLNIPGSDLPESYGASDFVYWYDGHPDYPRTWPLKAKEVAVIGVGNVALDISRVLSKHLKDILVTEIPENVVEGLSKNPVTDVHIFGRRGPAQVKFTPLELRELGQTPDVDVLVYEDDFQFDEASKKAIISSNQTRQVVKTLKSWKEKDKNEFTASRRIHIHLLQSPVAILGDDHVEGIRTERMKLNGDGTVSGTGEYIDTPVQAVYRAIGYFSSPIKGIPFDSKKGVIPNDEGCVIDENGEKIDRIYTTGWVKRGPVGLIGSTKSDAQQTISHILEDYENGILVATSDQVGIDPIISLLNERGVEYTTWHGWELLDSFERKLGDEYTTKNGIYRERIKVVSRDAMTAISHGKQDLPSLI